MLENIGKDGYAPSLYGIIGNPVNNSLSPAIHNNAFKEAGFAGIYLPFKVTDIQAAVIGIKALDIKGVSVTAPYKIKIMDFMDEIEPKALQIGAVNTVINSNGLLYGANTDWLGAIRAIGEKTNDIRGKRVAVAGAGGAARAIIFGLIQIGAKVTVFNRDIAKGEKLALEFSTDFIRLSDFKNNDFQILVNATNMGMFPNIELTPFKYSELRRGNIVIDIVYTPLKTRLLKEAEEAGCIVINGLPMLIYQAAIQSEIWTRKKAQIDSMYQSVMKKVQ